VKPQQPLRLLRGELFEIHVLLGLQSQGQQSHCEQLEAQQKQVALAGAQPNLQSEPSE
jgi:hypothetical protein